VRDLLGINVNLKEQLPEDGSADGFDNAGAANHTSSFLIPGVNQGHHDLSHHGQDPSKIAQLKVLELAKLKTLRDFLTQLRATKEDGESLLDRTMVFFSSNLGDASKHSVKNMPVLLAGGGFRHGQHLAFDENNHPPLCNLYISMLQRLGIDADAFGSGSATLTGLEMRA
jgi:hypothetical protein